MQPWNNARDRKQRQRKRKEKIRGEKKQLQ